MSDGTALPPRRLSIPASTRSAVGCVLVLVLGLALFAAVPPAAANPDDDRLRVELTGMSPAVLRPGDDLIITGTVSNDSDDVVAGPEVELIMQRQALTSRTAVDEWHQGTSSSRVGTATPFTEDLDDDLEPHSTTDFTITMPSSPTFADTSPWGPRGIEVNVLGVGGSGSARSLLLWFPEESPLPAPAELSVLLPLTPTSDEWHAAATEDLPVAATASDRMEPLLEAAQDHHISWALDPALLEPQPLVPPEPLDLADTAGADEAAPDDDATENGDDDGSGEDSTGDDANADQQDPADQPGSGEEPGTDGDATDPDDAGPGATDPPGPEESPAPPSAGTVEGPGSDLLDRLAEDAPGRDILALDYADADLPALAHAEDLSLWRLGHRRGEALLTEAGLNPLADVHLPAGRVDGTTLDALAGEDVHTVLVPETVLTPGSWAGLPEATTTVNTGSGPVHAVVPDARISALLSGQDPTGAELDDLTSRQLLLAETAAAVREDPTGAAGFLATLPREVTEEDLDDRLAELAEVPWMDLTNLRGLLGRTPAPQAQSSVAAGLHDPARLDPGRIIDLEDAYDEVAGLAAILPEPEALLHQFEPALLTTLSASWAQDTAAREDLLGEVDTLRAQVGGAVRVEPGSDVLLINHSGDLPVTVANDLPVPADVLVTLNPQDPRLRAGDPVQAVLEPGTITTVRMPIQAVANGNVDLDVQVLSADGAVSIGEGASFMVRVRADWEDIGTAVVASLLAVGFILGLVRTIRSGRRRFNPAAADTSDRARQDR